MNPDEPIPVPPTPAPDNLSAEPAPPAAAVPLVPLLELEPSKPATPPPANSASREEGVFAGPATPLPMPALPPEVPPHPKPLTKEPSSDTSTVSVDRGAAWNWVLPCMFLLSLFLLVLYAVPYLLYHWRMLDAQAEAEAVFMKRRAELKAEAQHADERLDLLDKRVHLTGLGFREVARKVVPNVVNVANLIEPEPGDMPLFKEKNRVFDPENDRKYVVSGHGSGLIYKPNVIITNFHVVKKPDRGKVRSQRLRITFGSDQSIGVDPSAVIVDAITDLAVIRLPEKMPAALKEEAQHAALFADSDKDVHVGDWALAIGSPLGLRQTVTQGIISAKGRLLNMLDVDKIELLQTDAAIFPGNSGGPLFDQLGRVMGINVAIVSDNGGNQGIGFAIPSNTVKRIADQLLAKGEVPRGYLGIAMHEVPGQQLKALKISDGAVMISDLIPGEPAAKAGLHVGDIILRINKDTLNRLQPSRHLRQLIVDIEPGAEATLEVLRDGQRRPITLTVGKRPANLP